jgi:acetamidase/formamidase
VHWGYFSKLLKPQVEVSSGDFVTIEVLTHHANDDAERMVKGDAGAESVFFWDKQRKGVDRRGAGPMTPTLFGRGAGEGLGVHICTGPVAVREAEPGDILEVRIIDVKPRPCANPSYKGKSFGSNAAAWWGFHYKDLLTEPKPREVITIYEVDASGERNWAKAVYNFRWTPQTDPFGVVHKIIDYPGVPVDHRTVQETQGVLKNIRVPIRPHFGVLGLAPAEADMVDSIPPSYTGGNIDDWRIGKGATMYYPVAVKGGLLSAGDSHASQGDSELCGTAIECSLTGTFQLIVHKRASLAGTALAGLNYPLLATQDEWVLHGFSYANYLAELGADAQSKIYEKSSIDLAMKDAFRKMRHFLMSTQGLGEDEAVSLSRRIPDGCGLGLPIIRNLIAVLAAADNVNPLARHLAAQNAGVVCLPASYGRGQMGEDFELSLRAMAGLAAHPNVAACLVVSFEPESSERVAQLALKLLF